MDVSSFSLAVITSELPIGSRCDRGAGLGWAFERALDLLTRRLTKIL